MTYFAPSELNYINCNRCFFINKVKGFKLPPNIPGVFSTFDRSQKKYFMSKDTDILSKELPKGKFFKTVTQEEIKDRLKKNLPEKISILRLDTDWYESTKIELEVLYPRLMSGGFLIIEDYGHFKGFRKAVDEYFKDNMPYLHYVNYTCRLIIKP